MRNKKIQKIVSTVLLLILIFQFICPSISFADSEFGYSKYEKDDGKNTATIYFGVECLNRDVSYEKYGKKYYTFSLNNQKMKDYVQTLYDNGTLDENTTVKFTYNEEITDYDYYDGVAAVEKYFRFYEDDGRDMTGDESKNLNSILNSIGVTFVFEGDKTGIEDVMDGIEDVSEDVNDLADNLNQGTSDNNVGMEEDDDEDSANIGGILLSPVFWLINFIADAIESNLGSIMMGDGLTLTGRNKTFTRNAYRTFWK